VGLDAIPAFRSRIPPRELNDFLIQYQDVRAQGRKVAKLIKQYDYPMVLNCVLHRLNIDQVRKSSRWPRRWGAEQVELANTQYYAWADGKSAIQTASRARTAATRAEQVTNECSAHRVGKQEED
jgi:pyrroloquinoline quinone biosynthesis protein E